MADPQKNCPRCGRPLPDEIQFCLACGAPRRPRPAPDLRCRRSRRGAILSAALCLAAAALCLAAAPALGAFLKNRGKPGPLPTETGETRTAPAAAPLETAERESASPDPGTDPQETAAPPVTSTVPPVTAKTPETNGTEEAKTTAETEPVTADGVLHHGGISVRLLNDLGQETSNYFAYSGEGVFQTFRVIRCDLASVNGVLRIRGSATAVTPAETDDKIGIQLFYKGQNQFTEPLLQKTVTVISKGVNEGITVAFDLAVADWERIAALGYSELLLFLADL